jgi:hypothetical protein
MHALAIMAFKKNTNNSFEVPQFQQYKKKIKAISKKIDKWHLNLTLKKEKSFKVDGDYVPNMSSPDQFSNLDTSSDEDI